MSAEWLFATTTWRGSTCSTTGLAQIEVDNPFITTSPRTISRRIKLYEAAKLDLIDCGVKP